MKFVFVMLTLSPGTALALVTTPTPKPYRAVLDLLRTAAADDRWPDTSPARARQLIEGRTITLANPATLTSRRRGPLANRLFPELAVALFELERVLAPTAHAHSLAVRSSPRPPSSSVAVNVDARFAPHVDLGHGAGPEASSLVVSLGVHTGGALAVPGAELELRHRPVCIDG